MAGAIVLDLAAFVVWMLAMRGPARLLAEIGAAIREPRALLHGLATFAAGLALLVAAGTLLVPVAPTSRAFFVLETWTVLTALLADQLVGLDAQRLLRRR